MSVSRGSPEQRPAWLRATQGERRWASVAGLLLAIAAQYALPPRLAVHPTYVVPSVELVALVGLTALHPDRLGARSPALRAASLTLLAVVAGFNAVSLVLLVHAITTKSGIHSSTLLLGGAAIWVTNVVVFALLLWEYDRGGPAVRAAGTRTRPDLLFPQLTDDELARDWEPEFVDYLFVSFTNSTAFSPTDTPPLARAAKLLFTLQAVVSLATLTLVLARAVNILPT